MKRRAAVGLLGLVLLTLAFAPLITGSGEPGANRASRSIRLAQSGVLAIRGGAIHTASGPAIEDGVVLVRDRKIAEVGRSVDIPADAQIIDAAGHIITPGIIDTRSWFRIRGGLWDRDELVSPARRMLDEFDPIPDSEWLRGGVTAVYLAPGPQNLLGGFGSVVKLVGDREGAAVRERAGMSASFGESALRAFEAPTTRQGMVARLRQELIRAQEYIARRQTAGADFEPDSAMEAIGAVLRREVPLRVVAHTPDDIMTAVRVAKEFDLRLVIDSGTGAHRVANVLAAEGVSVVVGASMLPLGGGGPFERFAHTPENAARLHAAGVKIALSTESRGGRSVLLEGVMAKAHGLPEEAALRAVTLDAAEILGVADRLGSIQAGKDADLVIWAGHPLSTWGETRWVIVNGRVVFEREAVESVAGDRSN